MLAHEFTFDKMRTKNPMAKKPQQILFSKNIYSSSVKVANWDYATHAEKKDNYVYRDKLSNHLSTYVRWGDDDQGVNTTETRYMLAQISTKTDPLYFFRPLVNFTSYPCTEWVPTLPFHNNRITLKKITIP